MLNPDGAQRFQRRNAQDIDINRDARLLQSAEGRTLKRIKDQVDPDFGFNLHDMRGREMVGKSKKLLNVAFMAPPFNEADEDSDSRVQAKKLVVVLKSILDRYITGHVARYDAEYMPRAFGDAMQNWGVSTVLIESGLHQNADPHFLVKMNFITLFGAFDAIAGGKLDAQDATAYDRIPLEGRALFDLLIKNVLVYNGDLVRPFKADVGINVYSRWRRGKETRFSRVVDLGDLDISGGLNVIDGEGCFLIPGLIAATSAQDPRQLGITTSAADLKKDQNSKLLKTVDSGQSISFRDLGQYTAVVADSLKMYLTGRIRRGKKADLVMYKVGASDQFDSGNPLLVIKEGSIVLNNMEKMR
jgi:hypothetical protein